MNLGGPNSSTQSRQCPGNTKGGSIISLYHWPPVLLIWNRLHDNWQFLFLFGKQTNPNQSNRSNPNQSNRRSTVQWYFPSSIPCSVHWLNQCRYEQPGNPFEEQGSVQLTSLYQVVWISCFWFCKHYLLSKLLSSYLNEEVKRTKPCPTVSVPWSRLL